MGSVLRQFERRRDQRVAAEKKKKITAGQPVTKQSVQARKHDLEPDNAFLAPLLDLREHCDNINKKPSLVLADGVYIQRNLGKIETVHVDGVDIGYGLEDLPNGFMMKKIFVKFPGYRIDEIPESQRDPIIAAIFEVFIDPGAGEVVINQIADDAMLIAQQFMPLIMVERQPGLVSLGPLIPKKE